MNNQDKIIFSGNPDEVRDFIASKIESYNTIGEMLPDCPTVFELETYGTDENFAQHLLDSCGDYQIESGKLICLKPTYDHTSNIIIRDNSDNN